MINQPIKPLKIATDMVANVTKTLFLLTILVWLLLWRLFSVLRNVRLKLRNNFPSFVFLCKEAGQIVWIMSVYQALVLTCMPSRFYTTIAGPELKNKQRIYFLDRKSGIELVSTMFDFFIQPLATRHVIMFLNVHWM